MVCNLSVVLKEMSASELATPSLCFLVTATDETSGLWSQMH